MPMTTVLFDLDETLIDQSRWYRVVLRQACEPVECAHGVDPDSLVKSLCRHGETLWREAPSREYIDGIGMGFIEGLWGKFDGNQPGESSVAAWTPAYRREAWRLALADHGVEDDTLVEELAASRPSEAPMAGLLFPEVEAVLADLQKDYRLGMVTNGVPAVQWRKIRSAGLERFLDAIVVAGEVGIGKPDPLPYRVALERLDTASEQAAMVGDRLETDILGALQIGLFTVWINRPGRTRQDIEPDAEVASLSELRSLLEARP